MSAELLRRAAEAVIDLGVTGGRPSFGSHESWIQEMPVKTAEALAVWLRSAAEDAEQVGADWQAVAFARALLGETS